jgi:hypothetical protein
LGVSNRLSPKPIVKVEDDKLSLQRLSHPVWISYHQEEFEYPSQVGFESIPQNRVFKMNFLYSKFWTKGVISYHLRLRKTCFLVVDLGAPKVIDLWIPLRKGDDEDRKDD